MRDPGELPTSTTPCIAFVKRGCSTYADSKVILFTEIWCHFLLEMLKSMVRHVIMEYRYYGIHLDNFQNVIQVSYFLYIME